MDPAGLFAIQGLLLAGVLAACTLLLSGCAAKTDYGEASTYRPTTSTKYNCYAYALGETEGKYVGGSPDAVQDFSVENVAKWYWMMQKLMEGLCASLILMIVPSMQMSTELH